MSPPVQPPVVPPAASPSSLLAVVVEASDDAILTTDLDGLITSWNDAAQRLFGYMAAEIVGRPVFRLLPADRLHEETGMLERVRRGGLPERSVTVRQRRDGSPVHVALTVAPLRDTQERVAGAVEILRDLTEARSRAAASELLAAIVSSSDDAIVSKNLDGVITSWNTAAQRLFGYTAEEIIGQHVVKLIPADRLDEEPRIIERLQRGERVEHFETVRRRKNGELFPVSLTISPVRDATGRIVGASKIARDITAVQHAARELARIAHEREELLVSERSARSQAEHANRMKDAFLATVSHELRTPLNAILGWTEILAEGGDNRDEVVHGIEVIGRNARMQTRLIEDLLDLGRISSGKMILHIEPCDLPTLVREAVQSVQHAADSKRIRLGVHIEGAPGLLHGDAKRLQQIVWNLLTNAIKFTPDDGVVDIAVARTDSACRLTVTDSGAGITPDFLPHLFERFRQADGSTTRRHGGLGIGLALVKELVELHGGSVTATSPGEGLGATFTVTLPVARPPAAARPADAQIAAAGSTMPDLAGVRVLAVDDDRDSLDVIRRILTGRHADVTTAATVDEALERLRHEAPDVILSDIGMPTQDGYDFIRVVRQLPGVCAIPAAALTALARPEDRTRALTAGFQTHVSKPIAAMEIVAAVRSLANLHRASASSAGDSAAPSVAWPR